MLGKLRTAKRKRPIVDGNHKDGGLENAAAEGVPTQKVVKGPLLRDGRGPSSSAGGGSSSILAGMLRKEREMDMDEAYVRNLSRLGKHYKRHVGSHFGSSTNGNDEDDQQIDMTLFQADGRDESQAINEGSHKASDIRASQKSQQRAEHREANLERKAENIASKCWWWMQSPTFKKMHLIALGDHVSLVIAPSHLSLVKGHCYLVPIKHAPSLCSCDDDAWNEMKRFQTSIRSTFAKLGKGVLFCETVLDAKSFWQARLEVIPVPSTSAQDAPMFFKSALAAHTDEFGTHIKLLSTKKKGLRGCIPKGFPYFYIEWEDGGFAQIIEGRFPKDFGVDTIASMIDVESLRFNRIRRNFENDRKAVLRFCDVWKEFDWTLELP